MFPRKFMLFLAYVNVVLFASSMYAGFYGVAAFNAATGTFCWIEFCKPEAK